MKKNIDFLKELDKDVYSFFQSGFSGRQSGRYDFFHGIYVNVDEYDTRARESSQYEAHRKYYDFQYVISGSEAIEKKDLLDDRRACGYDAEKDYALYGNEKQGARVVLCAGEGLLIGPGKLHMPCLHAQNDGPVHVKKAVVKIPASLFCDIKLLVMDVDGTLTDGKIYIGPQGEAFKAFNIKDGYGIHNLLCGKKIEPVIITGRKSEIVSNRCKELCVKECHQGVSDKLECLKRLAKDKGCDLSNVAYIGDDENDLACMKAARENGGLAACPSDAAKSVQDMASFVCLRKGGDGAVREFIDFLIL